MPGVRNPPPRPKMRKGEPGPQGPRVGSSGSLTPHPRPLRAGFARTTPGMTAGVHQNTTMILCFPNADTFRLVLTSTLLPADVTLSAAGVVFAPDGRLFI